MKFRGSSIAIFSLILPNILHAKYCVNIPPFLSRLRDGVDITKLDLLPLDWGTDDGFKNPVIDFTCDGGQMRNINNVRI